jgi:hypothetical protein
MELTKLIEHTKHLYFAAHYESKRNIYYFYRHKNKKNLIESLSKGHYESYKFILGLHKKSKEKLINNIYKFYKKDCFSRETFSNQLNFNVYLKFIDYISRINTYKYRNKTTHNKVYVLEFLHLIFKVTYKKAIFDTYRIDPIKDKEILFRFLLYKIKVLNNFIQKLSDEEEEVLKSEVYSFYGSIYFNI